MLQSISALLLRQTVTERRPTETMPIYSHVYNPNLGVDENTRVLICCTLQYLKSDFGVISKAKRKVNPHRRIRNRGE